MPGIRVGTAQDAIEIATTFLERYWTPVRPLRAERDDDLWVVTFEVGSVEPRSGIVKIGRKTGKIIDYVVNEPERRLRVKRVT